MCMFCAAIPATLALGAHANSRKRQEDQQAQAGDQPSAAPKVEPKAVTAIVVAGLVVASVVYHTQF
jgi:hypothetical protein